MGTYIGKLPGGATRIGAPCLSVYVVYYLYIACNGAHSSLFKEFAISLLQVFVNVAKNISPLMSWQEQITFYETIMMSA